jgi:DNA-binding Xre family transcriptional regulator
VNKKTGYRWNLRKIMATRDMFATTDLVPLLADCGIHLSREQVFRLVTTTPRRVSLDTLAALCDILDVGVEDLIEITETNNNETNNKSIRERPESTPAAPKSAWRATIRRPDGL